MAILFVPSVNLPSTQTSKQLPLTCDRKHSWTTLCCSSSENFNDRRKKAGEHIRNFIATAAISASLLFPASLNATTVQEHPLRMKSSFYSTEQTMPAMSLKVKWEGVRSLNSRTETYVLFENQSNTTVDVNWVNYNGYEEVYASMAPGSVHLQPSFATHPWSLRDHVTQDSLGQIVAGQSPKIAIVNEEGIDEVQGSKRGRGLLDLFGRVSNHNDELEMNNSDTAREKQ